MTPGAVGSYIVAAENVFQDAYYTCIFILNAILVCQMVNCLTLTVISIERFIAIRCPIWYKINYTKRVVWTSIAMIWSYAFTYLILAMFVFNLKSDWMETPFAERRCTFFDAIEYTFYTYASAIPTNIIPILVMIGVYVYLWKIVSLREKAKRKRSVKYAVEQENSSKVNQRKEVCLNIIMTLMINYPTHLNLLNLLSNTFQ